MDVIVPMSDMGISDCPGDKLITMSLGSCLGIGMYDPVLKIGGLIHCMLPDSDIHPRKAEENPYMFVDTGASELMNRMLRKGCMKKNLVIKAAGGACMMSDSDIFKIGERNYKSFMYFLDVNELTEAANSIGGNSARSIILDISSGEFRVKIKQQEVLL